VPEAERARATHPVNRVAPQARRPYSRAVPGWYARTRISTTPKRPGTVEYRAQALAPDFSRPVRLPRTS
jgi:hypothetical protein